MSLHKASTGTFAGEKDAPEIFVWIHEKPDTLPDDPEEMILKTNAIGKRSFKGENSMVHIRNFIVKFVNY